jgi:hypothetical protein
MATALRVRTETTDQLFHASFRIGRAEDCGLRIQNDFVSRYHAEVVFDGANWFVRDLGSSNGIFVGGVRVPEAQIVSSLVVRLGVEGPAVGLKPEQAAAAAAAPAPAAPLESTAVFAARYFKEPAEGEKVGEHTQMVRRAFKQVQTKQKRKHRAVVAVLLLLVAGVGGYAYYQHRQIQQRTALAKDLFYAMKALDVDIANVEKLVRDSQNQQGADQVQRYQSRQREMAKNYDRFLTSLRVYDPKMSEEQRLILRMARVFGECELDMPKGFVEEVQNYIKKWQSSGRLARAVEQAQANGYTQKITTEFLGQNLPPQFFYLALQESDFDPFISGPPTYKGIAKGMWQFIPETAVKYGLRIGPLAEFRRPDPTDERHQWQKATNAAARYIKDIYSTDAQASGLLVMASYNWGEHRVVNILRSMPANPRDRNFWKVLADHKDKVPKETYDYVYYIFSAAVIGENPKLFGFKFDNPLRHLEAH